LGTGCGRAPRRRVHTQRPAVPRYRRGTAQPGASPEDVLRERADRRGLVSSGVQSWNAGNVIGLTEQEVKRRVRVAQLFLVNTIKRSINRGSPTGRFPSLPGEPPKKVSARLFASIAAPEPTIENGVVRGRVGT